MNNLLHLQPCSVMPRQRKQQHLDLGDILGHKRKAGHREDGGAPKVTAEKMGRFVEAMSDLVKVKEHATSS